VEFNHVSGIRRMKTLLSMTCLLAVLGTLAVTAPPAAAQATTTTRLSASPNPIISGKQVTFTVTVHTTGSSLLAGFVDLSINGNFTPGLSLVNGVATTAIPFNTVGQYTVVATYTGDANNAHSSATVNVSVQAALGLSPTTISVISSANPAQVGEYLTYTATVAGNGASKPTGKVNFFFGSGVSPVTETLGSNGTATATTAFPNAGDYAITASYSGDANNAGSTSVPVGQSVSVAGAGQGLSFVAMAPCRIADTRNPPGPFGSPAIVNMETRGFPILQSKCGVPSTAVAYSLNVTVVPNGPLDYVTVWPAGLTRPLISLTNSFDGRVKANAAIVAAGTAGAINVFASTPTSTNIILDIDGYFVPSTSSSLAFYPLVPCRLVDTRPGVPPGPLTGPSLVAKQVRSFPIQSGTCKIPPNAQAYSLNVTALPPKGGTLGDMVIFPTGQKTPGSSTLNAPTGTATANAAIVPAGTGGAVSVEASNDIDLLLDINGYFAPPGIGGIYLYTMTPCRVVDTRSVPFPPFPGPFFVTVESSPCAPPTTAAAYVLNPTILPAGPVQFLTLWPAGESQPLVSTLNAADGAVTSNMAIVPTNNGLVSAFVPPPDTGNLLVDIYGYFAP
jgi:Bacterial Ig-like domain (group 3)